MRGEGGGGKEEGRRREGGKGGGPDKSEHVFSVSPVLASWRLLI